MTRSALRPPDLPAGSRDPGLAPLPEPPTDREKVSYIQRHRFYLATSLSLATFFVIASQVGFEIYDTPWLAPVTLLAVVQAVISLSVTFAGKDFDLRLHQTIVHSWRPSQYPSIDIFLPIAGEPIEVLNNTWTYVSALARSYPGRLVVYVLDDGDSQQAGWLAERFGFTYVVRPDRGYMRKAGNLRHAFRVTGGEFIVIFDADFCPRTDFLSEILPYFRTDPRVGIVQTPQFFRTDKRQSWVERAGDAVQEIFYRNIQVARDYYGTAVCCGTSAIYRRSALAPQGGFATVPYAEDEHTGLDVRENGYTVRYIPVALASGLSPSTPDMFVRQQYRWCSGTYSTLRRWPKGARLKVRLTYAAGLFYYLYSAVMVFAGPAVPLTVLIWFPQNIKLLNYLIFAPVMLSGMVLYPLWHRCDYGPSVWPLAILRGWAHVLALIDFLTRRTMQWKPTGGGKSPVTRLWLGVYGWNFTTAIAWLALTALRIRQYGAWNYLFVAILGVYYAGVVMRVIIPSRKGKA
jgi:cellulose synthase (UDP-forming)